MGKKNNRAGKMFRLLLGTMLGVFLCGMCAMARTENVTMQVSNEGISYSNDWGTSDVSVYHKFTMKKAGVLVLTGTKVTSYGQSGLSVWLCNSKKKAMERDNKKGSYVKTVYENGGTNVESAVEYRLAKGTYYIKTKGAQAYVLIGAVSTTLDNVALKDTGGASKTQAKMIAAGKKIGGIIGVGEAKGAADWYKFKVSRSQVLNFEVLARGSAGLTFTLYGPSFAKGIDIAANLKDNGSSVRTVKKNQWGSVVGDMKVKTGIYYIKVTRGPSSYYRDKKLSADYYIMWK